MGGDRAALAQEQPRGTARGRPAGSSWRDVPERYGPRTTLYNRFTRWRAAGVWDRLLEAVSRAYDGGIVMIDSSCVRVDQHGAAGKRGDLPILAWDAPAAA